MTTLGLLIDPQDVRRLDRQDVRKPLTGCRGTPWCGTAGRPQRSRAQCIHHQPKTSSACSTCFCHRRLLKLAIHQAAEVMTCRAGGWLRLRRVTTRHHLLFPKVAPPLARSANC